MDPNVKQKILNEYQQKLALHKDLSDSLETLLRGILKDNSIHFHSINTRVKKFESFERKLIKADKYNQLEDIADVVGGRVITYFESDVESVCKIMEKEFHIIKEHSVDKRNNLEPNEFGYISIHYACNFIPDRLKLTEYKRFSGCRFEIQIRSILQHAWAEIEHDLGYKTTLSIPKPIRRRFSRLAGLLELADIEFVNIRGDLINYEKDAPQKIASLFIDKISYQAFLEKQSDVLALDQQIGEIMNASLSDAIKIDDYDIFLLNNAGLKTIEDLNKNLNKFQNLIIPFARKWIEYPSKQRGDIERGISVFYLCYLIISSSGSYETVLKYFKDTNLGGANLSEEMAKRLTEKLIKIFKDIQNEHP